MTDQMFGHQKAVAYVSDIFPKPQSWRLQLVRLVWEILKPKDVRLIIIEEQENKPLLKKNKCHDLVTRMCRIHSL